MEPLLVVLAPLIIIVFALLMSSAEKHFVVWKPRTVTQDGEVNLHNLSTELTEQLSESQDEEHN